MQNVSTSIQFPLNSSIVPTFTNAFSTSRLGDDIIVTLGYLDPDNLHLSLSDEGNNDSVIVQAQPVVKLVMSVVQARVLASQLAQAAVPQERQ
jgi:hypothetical protein